LELVVRAIRSTRHDVKTTFGKGLSWQLALTTKRIPTTRQTVNFLSQFARLQLAARFEITLARCERPDGKLFVHWRSCSSRVTTTEDEQHAAFVGIVQRLMIGGSDVALTTAREQYPPIKPRKEQAVEKARRRS